jgi:hypothetical protein
LEDGHPTEHKQREKPSGYTLGRFFSNPAKNFENFHKEYPRQFGVDHERDFKKPRY